jgi:aspartate/methionine/tyrosine aminotransferase
MAQRLADRLQEIGSFKAMDLLARARQLDVSGHRVVHMEVGEPDFPTPGPIVEAGHRALADGCTRYTDGVGLEQLRERISDWYHDHYGLAVSASRIVVTAGASGALLLASAMVLNTGEGLLMSDPGYPCNRHFMKAFHGEGQLVPVTPDDGYQLSGALLEKHWQSNTRGALIASPANPTGAMIGESALRSVLDVLSAREGWLVMDEIYHGLTYGSDGWQDSVLALTDDALVINSFSKYFGMTGWRLGWLVVPDTARLDAEKLSQNLFICASSVAQHAALAAFDDDAQAIMERQRQTLRERRAYLLEALRGLGFRIPRDPDGAFYIYAQIPDHLPDAESWSRNLLEEHYVSVTPGTDFGNYLAERHVRFTYVQDIAVLEEGVARIKRSLG